MPIDYSKYPENWKDIRHSILIRAGGNPDDPRIGSRCEWCGVVNYAYGARDLKDNWHDENNIDHMNSSQGEVLFGDYPKIIRIVLTVAHVDDPDPMNCEPSNLAALCQRCQRCHNRHDAPMRARRSAKTRRINKAKRTGQLSLFKEE